jgi:hypothetical protein
MDRRKLLGLARYGPKEIVFLTRFHIVARLDRRHSKATKSGDTRMTWSTLFYGNDALDCEMVYDLASTLFMLSIC